MSAASAIRKMVAAGLSYEQALIAIEVFEQEQAEAEEARKAAKREGNRIRQQRRRSRDVTPVTDVTHVTRDKENTPTPPKENNPPSPPKGGSSPRSQRERFGDPAIALQSILDPVTARAVCDHCKQLKRPLTEQSAPAYVEILEKVQANGGNPIEAARFAMTKGWAIPEFQWFVDRGFPLKAKPPDKEIDWLSWCKVWFQARQWNNTLGPNPEYPGCKAPPEIIEQARREAERQPA